MCTLAPDRLCVCACVCACATKRSHSNECFEVRRDVTLVRRAEWEKKGSISGNEPSNTNGRVVIRQSQQTGGDTLSRRGNAVVPEYLGIGDRSVCTQHTKRALVVKGGLHRERHFARRSERAQVVTKDVAPWPGGGCWKDWVSKGPSTRED